MALLIVQISCILVVLCFKTYPFITLSCYLTKKFTQTKSWILWEDSKFIGCSLTFADIVLIDYCLD